MPRLVWCCRAQAAAAKAGAPGAAGSRLPIKFGPPPPRISLGRFPVSPTGRVDRFLAFLRCAAEPKKQETTTVSVGACERQRASPC